MAVTSIVASAATFANNAIPAAPALPAHAAGDVLIIIGHSRGGSSWQLSAASITAGWSQDFFYDGDAPAGFACFFKFDCVNSSAPAPTFASYSNGSNGTTTSMFAIKLSGAKKNASSSDPLFSIASSNQVSAQNIAFDKSVTVPTGDAILAVGWKADDWTSTVFSGQAAGLTWAENVEASSTLGNDLGINMSSAINSTGSNYAPGTAGVATVTGGAAAFGAGVYLRVRQQPVVNSFPPLDPHATMRPHLVR